MALDPALPWSAIRQRVPHACRSWGDLLLLTPGQPPTSHRNQTADKFYRDEGDWDTYTTYKYSIKATATDADLPGALGAVGAKTPFTVDCGDFRYTAVPSDDPNWTSGKTKAQVVEMGYTFRDREKPAFTMSLKWGKGALVVGIKSGKAADEAIYYSDKAGTVSDTIDCRIGVGGVEKAFPVQVSATGRTETVTKGRGEYENEYELWFLDVVGTSA